MKSNRKYILLGILVLAFLIMCVVPVCGLSESSTNCPICGLANSESTEVTATHDTQWMYYREVTIKENSGTALTNYQVLVELNPSNFPDKAKSDGSDLRFVEDGKELGYWIEDYDAGAKTAKIWVNVSNIPANGEAKIKMYYGNPSATSESSGDATFIFYDEIPNGDKWYFLGDPLGKVDYSVGNPAPSIKGNGDGRHSSGALSKQKFDYSNGLWLEADIKTESDLRCGIFALPTTDDYWNWIDGGVLRSVQVYLRAGETTKRGFYVRDVGGYAEDWYDTNWHKYAIAILPKGTVVFYVDGTHKWTSTGTINPSYNNHGILIIGHDPEYWFDNVKVRKYATPEPTLSISEELSTQKDLSLTPTPTPPEGGLVGYWNFNEGSGNIAYDSSGSGNDGTIHGATFVSGISGQALRFDGKDDYVSAPVDINPTVMPQMTITAWVRADNDSGTIVSHDDGGFDRTIDIDTRGGGKGWSAFSGSGVVGYSPVTIGEWFFLAAVYDQSAETVKLYVNGALISEEKGKLGSGWDYINIGKNPSFGDYFSGTVDEVMIYNYDLTKSEVKSLYEGGEAPEEEESGYGDIKVTYISWEEVQEKYTVSYDETFKYDDDGDGANEATLYYKGENNLVMSSDDTDKDGKVDLIFHYDDEEFLTRAIRDTDGDGELDQILHFNRDEEIIKVEKIRSDDTRNSILFIILGSIIFFLVMSFWLYVTKKQSYNSKINHQLGRRLILILISFLIIFALLVPPVSSLDAVIDDDCNIIQDVFDRDWKKYSNIDEQIPLDEREWPAKQYGVTQSKIVDAKVQIFFLKRDIVIDRLMRSELQEYKEELKDGHRKNLLKSFMRLSFLTVHTTWEAYQGGKSLFGTPKAPGGSYGNLFTTPSYVSAAGSVLKITDTYKSMAPPDSTALAKNTQSITKSVDDVSKNVALEALESLGDPTKVGTELVKQVIDAVPVPHKAEEWKLTDDDFNILRKEHLEMKRIDKIIAKSNRVNLERKDKVRQLEAQIKELEKELAEWETKEKNRVKASLVDSCKKEKEKKCDSEHLYLCDNENDCEDAGGSWYNNQCNKEEKEEEVVLVDCPPCVESGLQLDAGGSSRGIASENFFGVRCTYLGSSHDLLQDKPSEDDVSSSPGLQPELIPDMSREQDSLGNEQFVDMGSIDITTDKIGVASKTVKEKTLYRIEDPTKPDSVSPVPHVIVECVFLYRDEYYIHVKVSMYDRSKSAVINTFDELVNCAKAVVDEREGVD